MKAFLQHLLDVLVVALLILLLIAVVQHLDPEPVLLRLPH